MDVKSLEMFQHLSHSLHFGKTAQAYHVSPSTLSRTIQRMEETLGTELLHRDNRKVTLTDAGIQFKAYAKQQLEQWQLLKFSLEEKQTELKGKLHIYCSVTAAYSHLPKLLDRFRQQYPLVEIMLTTGDASDALQQIQDKSVDIAIAAKPDSLPASYFFHHLAEVPLTVIAPTIACTVQQQLQSNVIDWSKIPIILAESGSARTRFEKWYRSLQLGKPNIYATVSGHEAIVSMVALGCGIGIAPQVVVENSPVKERIYNLVDESNFAPLELGLCCLNIKREQTLVKAFLATCL
jgi:LysR family positive regulator for ilvC